MSERSLGTKVDNADDEDSAIVAIFPTIDGNFRYVADMKEYDALQFFNEDRRVVVSRR